MGESDKITKIFHLCYRFDASNTLDVWTLFNVLLGTISGVVQYQHEENQNIQNTCGNLEKFGNSDDLEALAMLVNTDSCNVFRYVAVLDFYKKTSWSNSIIRFFNVI